MTDPGVPYDDMLSFLWRSRMDIPQIGDEALDALLAATVGGGKVAAYCASAPRPGVGTPASYATGRATSRPGHTPAGKHKGKAASR